MWPQVLNDKTLLLLFISQSVGGSQNVLIESIKNSLGSICTDILLEYQYFLCVKNLV